MSNGHITYAVAGEDKEGNFEVQRRFNDFFELHASIFRRWPGVFVCNVPPKKNFVRDLYLKNLEQKGPQVLE